MKILMLHGYTQSAEIFSRQLAALRKSLPNVEMVFIDGPGRVFMATEIDEDDEDYNSVPSRAWWSAKDMPDGTRKYVGSHETLTYLRQVIERERPDAVWGFSQGASLAGLLTAVMLRPELHPAFANPADPPLKPLKFAIIAGGFKAVDPAFESFWSHPIETPSLHIIGRSDHIVGLDRTLPYLNCFVNPRPEYHEGGHFIPTKTTWRDFFCGVHCHL